MNNKYSLSIEKFKNVFAVTGGIGCGKSTVLRIFETMGCYVIDSDKICHGLYTKHDFTNILIGRWGNAIVTEGAISRHKVAKIVFGDVRELNWLNNLIHPEVLKCAYETIENCRKGIVLFDVPLLFELKLEKLFKATIAVWTDRKTQYNRIEKRDGLALRDIDLRLSRQLSPEIKLERANFGIINTGDLNFLNIQCKNIFFNIKRGNDFNERTRDYMRTI